MSENYEFVQCGHCVGENDSESYGGSEDNLDDFSCSRSCSCSETRKNTVEIEKKNLADCIEPKYPSKSVACRDTSRQSVAVETLRKTDANKINRISMQNLKLSSIFPEASFLSKESFLFLFFFFFIRRVCKINIKSVEFRSDVFDEKC